MFPTLTLPRWLFRDYSHGLAAVNRDPPHRTASFYYRAIANALAVGRWFGVRVVTSRRQAAHIAAVRIDSPDLGARAVQSPLQNCRSRDPSVRLVSASPVVPNCSQ